MLFIRNPDRNRPSLVALKKLLYLYLWLFLHSSLTRNDHMARPTESANVELLGTPGLTPPSGRSAKDPRYA